MIAIAPEVRAPRGALPKRELAAFVRAAAAAVPLIGEVSVLLTDDAGIQELNRRFRRKNKPTDVLSFPSEPSGFEGGSAFAGDIAVSVDTARRQAAQLHHSLLLEVKVLLLHGLLHLAAYDHEQDTGQMARRERTLRRQFQLPAGLIQRSSEPPPAQRAPTKEKKRRVQLKAILREDARGSGDKASASPAQQRATPCSTRGRP